MAKSSYRLYCAVDGCLNSTITHPDITFFKLPGNSERRLEWLRLICRNDLKNKANFVAYRICETHFKVEDIHQSLNRKLLKKNVLPLLMLPRESSAVPDGFWKEDKHTQTALSIGVENCTQTENAATESYAQTSTSLASNTPKESKLKAELLKCRKRIKLQEVKNKTQKAELLQCRKIIKIQESENKTQKAELLQCRKIIKLQKTKNKTQKAEE